MTPRVLPESAVLKPRDPSNTDSDNWPVFELVDVVVTDPNQRSQPPTTLLHASAHYPLIVTGRLRQLPKQLTHLYLPDSHRSSPIEINDVRSFSYGAYEDGSIGLWACGKAGWFLVNPSPSYRQIYAEMTEAVKMLHFIADTYTTPRSSGKSRSAPPLPDPSPRELFQLYAERVMGREATSDEAAERVYKHRIFLLSSMITGKEGIAWSKKPLYKHLYKKFPADWERVREMLSGPAGQQSWQEGPARARAPSVESSSTTSSLKRKRGRPAKDGPSDVVSIASSSAASSAVKARTQKTKNETSNRSSPTVSQIRPTTSTQTRTRQGSLLGLDPGTPEAKRAKSEDEDEDSDTDSVPHPRKGKSALRLKPNVSSKGPPMKGKSAIKEDEDDEDESQRTPLLPTNRTNRNAQRTTHRPTIKTEVDEGISMPSSPSSTSQAHPTHPPPPSPSASTTPPTPSKKTHGSAPSSAARTKSTPRRNPPRRR